MEPSNHKYHPHRLTTTHLVRHHNKDGVEDVSDVEGEDDMGATGADAMADEADTDKGPTVMQAVMEMGPTVMGNIPRRRHHQQRVQHGQVSFNPPQTMGKAEEDMCAPLQTHTNDTIIGCIVTRVGTTLTTKVQHAQHGAARTTTKMDATVAMSKRMKPQDIIPAVRASTKQSCRETTGVLTGKSSRK